MLDAVNRRGKAFRCGVVCMPLSGPQAVSGVIVMMEAQRLSRASGVPDGAARG